MSICIRAERKIAGVSPPYALVVGGCQFGIYEFCKFSNITLEVRNRLCLGDYVILKGTGLYLAEIGNYNIFFLFLFSISLDLKYIV